MLIAKEKKKENLAEYILYMWQVEDMLRTFGMDIERVNEQLIANYPVEESTKKEMYDWYDNLIEMMRKEGVESKGHLQFLKNNVEELTELHYYLLEKAHDMRYQQIVMAAAGNLVEFRRKSGVGNDVSDVELALNALYGILMLRLQKKEINSETTQAMESFSKMIAYLAAKYKQMEAEENKL